jgi:hypothetical protein
MAKEFAWDSEELLGEVMVGDKVKFETKRCELGDKSYIAVTKWILTKQGWSYPKNSTFTVEAFTEIAELVNQTL